MNLSVCLLCALLVGNLAACDDREDDVAFRTAAAQVTSDGTCSEVYPYVVEAPTFGEAKAACGDVCSGVICEDAAPAVASVPGIAGDEDTWLCDCKCGCTPTPIPPGPKPWDYSDMTGWADWPRS